jgi:hypothetical protein
MPLNPGLFRSLAKVFKRGVKIQKEGERMAYRVLTSQITGRPQIHVSPGQGGEDYKVCCPFCNDTRWRLEISHRWNTRDEATDAYFGAAFVRCYNDGCDMNPDASWRRRLDCHEKLVDLTKPYIARNRSIVYEEPLREKKPIKLPDKCLPIVNLDASHHAIKYLEGRAFKIDYLFRSFSVLYCLDDPNPMVAGRIIIPFYMNTQLVGWQARCIGEPESDNVPKYYTAPGTQRNQTLYNYDNAKSFPFGVLVEGPTDVWRVGNTGVAPLGSAVSRTQIQLLQVAWKDGGIGLMLDPDYIKKPRKDPLVPTPYEKLRTTLSDPTAFKNGMLEIVLPEGMDPGKFDNSQLLWQFIKSTARIKGYEFP